MGSTVLHCPYCHGWEARDKAIGILAVDMAAAMHQALPWRQLSADVRLAGGRLLERDALVVPTRLEARAGYLAELGLEPVEQFMGKLAYGTAVPADPAGATSVPGVYAAGNLVIPAAQVITSASLGLMAWAAINAGLVAEETALAVAALAGTVPAEA